MAQAVALGQLWPDVVGLQEITATTSDAWLERLACPSGVPRILCGDFNAPRDELADGTVVPWGPDARTAAAEVSVLVALGAHDLVDAFRSVHGDGARAISWHGMKVGYRLDHVMASRALRPRYCRYLDALRISRLSDHAAVEVLFDWTGAGE